MILTSPEGRAAGVIYPLPRLFRCFSIPSERNRSGSFPAALCVPPAAPATSSLHRRGRRRAGAKPKRDAKGRYAGKGELGASRFQSGKESIMRTKIMYLDIEGSSA